jgi:hypothetical protein
MHPVIGTGIQTIYNTTPHTCRVVVYYIDLMSTDAICCTSSNLDSMQNVLFIICYAPLHSVLCQTSLKYHGGFWRLIHICFVVGCRCLAGRSRARGHGQWDSGGGGGGGGEASSTGCGRRVSLKRRCPELVCQCSSTWRNLRVVRRSCLLSFFPASFCSYLVLVWTVLAQRFCSVNLLSLRQSLSRHILCAFCCWWFLLFIMSFVVGL